MISLPPSWRWAPLHLKIEGAELSFQRYNAVPGPQGKVDTLVVHLGHATCRVVQQAPLPRPSASDITGTRLVAAVLGIAPLTKGCVLALAGDVAQVGVIDGSAVYKIRRIDIYTHALAEVDDTDRRLVLVLKEALDTKTQASHCYFSYSLDLTRSCQAQAAPPAAAAGGPPAAWRLVDGGYAWNGHLARPLLVGGAAAFVAPVVCGCFAQVRFPTGGEEPAAAAAAAPEAAATAEPGGVGGGGAGGGADGADADDGADAAAVIAGVAGPDAAAAGAAGAASGAESEASLCLVARVGCRRPSAGIWRRGLDGQGCSAGLVQCEVLLTQGRRATPVASHVHLRGGAPLLWWQVPNLQPRAPPQLAPSRAAAQQAFVKHMDGLRRAHGAVLALGLLSARGLEAPLHKAFEEAASAHVAAPGTGGGFSHASFDFRAECAAAGGAAGALERLDRALAAALAQHGCHVWGAAAAAAAPARQQRPQAGVLRLHSLEGVDRAAVAGGLAALRGAELCLAAGGLLEPGQALEDGRPEVEGALRRSLAVQADALALQLAGSEALHTELTRLGRGTLVGAFDCLAMRLARWYSDAYVQYKRQDALDVLHGVSVAPRKADCGLGARRQPAKAWLLLAALVQAICAAGCCLLVLMGRLRTSSVEGAAMVLVPAAVAAALLSMVLRDSDSYVCWPEAAPQLLPRQPPWERAAAGGGAIDPRAPAVNEPKKKR